MRTKAVVLLSGGDESSTATTTAPEERTNLYYLRAVAPKVAPNGCSMRIRFIWKPDYHALLGGYKLWSARVTAMDGDPPGNDTTVQTATPTGTKCD